MPQAQLQPTFDAEQFAAAPTGKIFTRSHFVYIGVSRTLLSLVIWGHIHQRDVDELIEVLTLLGARASRRDALLQMQAVTGVDEESLRALARFMATNEKRSRAVTRREAIVRPSGTMGMIVSGFYGVVPARYPTAIFSDRNEACAWLKVPASLRARLAAASDGAIASGHGCSDLGYQLREYLAAKPSSNDIDAVARQLHTSPRTLQRRLVEIETSFEREVGLARVAAAKNLLLRSSLAVKEIAHEVGLPSASRLTQLFTDHARTTPSKWRAAHAR